MRIFLHIAERIVGRRMLWRAARATYMWARAEPVVNTRVIGAEVALQRRFISLAEGRDLVVFDVGANSGKWSLAMIAAVATRPDLQLVLHAFEPVTDTYAQLCRVLPPDSDRLKIVAKQLALSSSVGTAEMELTGGEGTTNSLHPPLEGLTTSRERVTLTTLDHYVRHEELPGIDLLKCDTEGHEYEVLIGARRLLEDGLVGVVQFEYNHRWVMSRHYLRDIFELVRDLPYAIGKMSGSELVVYRHWHPEIERFFEANYLLIREDLVEPLAGRVGDFDHSNVFVSTR